ncbi:PRC-barrel domain-containing protein [Aurantimonas sp. Leaf443]|uniref:PRC-barrel domain-containing protein n=1 Tax=Aurantimonas sp. Leaf443 TaxID=1736378 RepID=UPI0006FB6F31|nr:PRC-barrel domain-containing protein [Aurantimonas sp. Leaf443]KQT86245.1 hypothetical protein ASG48_06665 [Aurantimonas sp. Leaf443]
MSILRNALPLAFVTAALGLSAPAFAQTTASTTPMTMVDVNDDAMVPMLNVSADDLEDMDVYDASGKEIGEIDSVMGANETTASVVKIDFDDSVVSDDEDRVVPIENLAMNGKNLVVNLDPAAITALPQADD